MDLLDLAKKRCSVRQYAATPVEKEKLDYILEVARLAPSAVNFQPWQFLVVSTKENLEKVQSCYEREWLKTAPLCIIACEDHAASWKRGSDGKDHADIDIAIAVEHICLAAAEQGLGTCRPVPRPLPVARQSGAGRPYPSGLSGRKRVGKTYEAEGNEGNCTIFLTRNS